MKKLLLIVLIFFTISSCSQNIDDIVCEISDSEVFEYQYISIAGFESSLYKKFIELSKKATNDQLEVLLYHENPVVTCYASWALIEKEYDHLSKVFKMLLDDDRTVKTFSGCIIDQESLSDIFYYRYLNSLKDKEIKENVLFELDKIIIGLEKPDNLLLNKALENRHYPNEFKDVIYNLGFEKNYKEAIFYLCNWHRSEYNYELQLFIIEKLKKTEFKGSNSSTYYKYLDELIKFKNTDVYEFILHKYRTDKPHIDEIENFKKLLERNNIF